ncbi:glycoside hydrolase family 15 protein [Rhabdothermincola sp.]|uniref:glycoside hydrolase family 15 protein n=1 Tax=Rhabdothermincola sp. TaxID=2820405 RepID=UPI002FE0C462
MPSLIEDYAIIGDTETVALVGRDGSIDWFCAPRFDSAACFAALLGDRHHGRWLLAPHDRPSRVERRYRGDTLVLETVFTTPAGQVAIIDFMPIRRRGVELVRIVEGRSGTVRIDLELIVRFDYGAIVPWVRAIEGGGVAIGGADGLVLRTPVKLEGRDLTTVASFEVSSGDRVPFVMQWFPSHEAVPDPIDAVAVLEHTERWWQVWSARCAYEGDYADAVMRSLITLKALTHAPTGGVVAAATTSLPEYLGGVRNWDYRYCWLRDATFTLTALSEAGYGSEAVAWSEWLRRVIAGSPDKMQIMYGVGGERRLVETVIDWLPGYEGSTPVRIGNAASGQFQLDVYGEVMDMFLHSHACLGNELPPDAWDLARMLVEHVREVWTEPDDGIWEVRGPRRHFVHSKVMAWVAIDRWVHLCELGAQAGVRPHPPDLSRWMELRDDMHREICEKGYDPAVGAFTQYYGSTELDASCLMLALVGFLPPTDPRIVGTVEAIQRELLVDGFVRRYRTEAIHDAGDTGGPGQSDAPTTTVDGLPPGEGAFLLTTFWLLDNLVLLGRVEEARAGFERLLALCNDVGLLSEEYDVEASRQLGNFPQAFSHVGLILTAHNLTGQGAGPAHHRALRHPHRAAAPG